MCEAVLYDKRSDLPTYFFWLGSTTFLFVFKQLQDTSQCQELSFFGSFYNALLDAHLEELIRGSKLFS